MSEKIDVNEVEECCPPKEPCFSEVAEAWRTIEKAVSGDYDYAWAIHCNIAMPIFDAGGVSIMGANKIAASLMKHIFNYDVTGLSRYERLIAAGASSDVAHEETNPPSFAYLKKDAK